MQEIWVEHQDGSVECIDTAESESEAVHLVVEYNMAFNGCVKRVWMQLAG